ncbi:hypothetical protein BS17DRAFT_772464, partial [Gyrodon lividus]
MDFCNKCLDYFCFGPCANRERSHPWKTKSRAVPKPEPGERATCKEEKRRASVSRHPKNTRARSQNSVPLSHNHDSQWNHIECEYRVTVLDLFRCCFAAL